MSDKSENKQKRYFTEIFITQSICVVIMLIIILITKFCFKTEFKKLKNFYKEQICTHTTVEEVLETEE